MFKKENKMTNKELLVKYSKILAKEEFVIGSGGNISVREKNSIIIKKSNVYLSKAKVNDYEKVSFKEAEKFYKYKLSIETPFHLACYKVRQDINAIIHVHPINVIAFANKEKVLKNISYEFNYILKKEVPVIDFFEPGSEKLKYNVSQKAEKGYNGMILKKHGLICLGKDLEQTYLRVLAVNRACEIFLLSNKD